MPTLGHSFVIICTVTFTASLLPNVTLSLNSENIVGIEQVVSTDEIFNTVTNLTVALDPLKHSDRGLYKCFAEYVNGITSDRYIHEDSYPLIVDSNSKHNSNVTGMVKFESSFRRSFSHYRKRL